jgi:carboxypeptidase Q
MLAVAGILCVACVRPPAVAPTPPEDPAISALRDEALNHSRAAEWVEDLTLRVGPRLSGSAGDAKAVVWGLATMKTLGLQNVRAEKVVVPHWERGNEQGAIVAPVSQRLALVALGDSVGTPANGLEAEVIEASSLAALEALPDTQVRGKIVFFNKITARTKTGEGYGNAVDVRGEGPALAARKGAVAVVIRSISTSKTRLPHTGALRYADGVPPIPAAALAVPDAEALAALLQRGGPVRISLSLGCQKLPDADSANVVGEIPGREKPDEIILLGAHLDSWDLGTGALDDGAGVGIVLEVGRLLAKLERRPRRTTRVILFANEEHGLSGGNAYGKAHAAELGQHIAAVEMDLGDGPVSFMSALTAPEAKPVVESIATPLLALGIPLVPSEMAFGADLRSLRLAGVPILSLGQDATTYFDYHHSADDTFDKVDAKKLAQSTAAAAVIVYGAAEANSDLGRIPEALRDRKK